ncbi:MAG: bifunctional nicotinamidase/pyrazinamidase [Spirochaetaceae bacterium]|nr:MAG: bifunctional nicotinamidase/pyrazinamidase [Spirochaetaceae bacterium]
MQSSVLVRSAMIVVDVQRDFCPGGALAVDQGDQVVPVINALAPRVAYVAATKDWHPAGHVSFASSHSGKKPFDSVELADGTSQILWPDHCVQATPGSEFQPDLDTRPLDVILHKGANPRLDSYSAFFENDKRTSTGLVHLLRGNGFDTLLICGLATDVCVFFTAMDARKLGFSVYVVEDACRGVDVPSGSVQNALTELRSAGCQIVHSAELSS